MTVRDWVEAVVTLAKDLSELFRRARPELFSDHFVLRQELIIQELDSWVTARWA
jgi:hypothetical protein